MQSIITLLSSTLICLGFNAATYGQDNEIIACPNPGTLSVIPNTDKQDYPNSDWAWLTSVSTRLGGIGTAPQSGLKPGVLVGSKSEYLGSFIGWDYLCIYKAYAKDGSPATTKRVESDIGAGNGYIFYRSGQMPEKGGCQATSSPIGFKCPWPSNR